MFSRVMPAPPAAFSPLAITRSASDRDAQGAHVAPDQIAARAADDVAEKQQLHPRDGVSIGMISPAPRRSVMRGSTTRSSPLARRARACAPSMAALILTARAKRPKSRSTRWKLAGPRFVRSGRSFFADDQHHAGLEQDADRIRGDAGKVEHDLPVFSVSKTSTTGMHSPATRAADPAAVWPGHRVADGRPGRDQPDGPSIPKKTWPSSHSNQGSGLGRGSGIRDSGRLKDRRKA